MSTELATRRNDVIELRNMDDLARLAKMFADSGYFKDAKDAAQAGVKILAGREMGFGPFASLNGIHLIQGRPSMGANLMAAAIKSSGKYDYRVRKMDDDAVSIEFFQGSESLGVSTFTAKDAKAAGTQNMQKFPRNMLYARAMSNGVKWYTPDVFTGNAVYTPEELGAQVDGDGEIVDVQVRVERDTPPAKVEEPQKATTPAEKPQEAKQQDDGQFPPEDDMPESLSGQSEPEKEAPVTISAKKAKDLGTKLAELGTPAKDHVQLARDATGRDDIEALTDLNTKEALLVYKFANGETVEIPSGTEVAA